MLLITIYLFPVPQSAEFCAIYKETGKTKCIDFQVQHLRRRVLAGERGCMTIIQIIPNELQYHNR